MIAFWVEFEWTAIPGCVTIVRTDPKSISYKKLWKIALC
jgi:hypothetical protein